MSFTSAFETARQALRNDLNVLAAYGSGVILLSVGVQTATDGAKEPQVELIASAAAISTAVFGYRALRNYRNSRTPQPDTES